MQQTTKYKLNKPEMGDVFSTAPLNENMDTVERELLKNESGHTALRAAVTASDAKHCLIKLGGPVVIQEDNESIHFDLSAVDMGQFVALLFLGRLLSGGATVKLNTADGEVRSAYLIGGGGYSGAGFALIQQARRTLLSVMSFCAVNGGSQGIVKNHSQFAGVLAEVVSIDITGSYKADSGFVVYGIKG